jgi:hypothetical protein
MNKKWRALIIIGSILVLVVIILLFLKFENTWESRKYVESRAMNNFRNYTVNLAKCYSSCPIVEEESIARDGEIFYYVNLSCREQCHETFGYLTGGDILDMNLSEYELEKESDMFTEFTRCIQGYDKENISSCFGGYIQKYS